nr:putative selenium-dependent hydroxylase accessory protein YqeC [Desulfobacula sp.]
MAPLRINSLCSTPKGVISIIGAGGKTSLMFCLAKEISRDGGTVLTTTTTKIFFPDKALSPETVMASSAPDLVEKSQAVLNRHPHFSAGRHHDLSSGKLEGFSPDVIDSLWQAGLFDWVLVEADGSRQKPLKPRMFTNRSSLRQPPALFWWPGWTAWAFPWTRPMFTGPPFFKQYGPGPGANRGRTTRCNLHSPGTGKGRWPLHGPGPGPGSQQGRHSC